MKLLDERLWWIIDSVSSKELHKNVTYNFAIAAGGSLASPVSALDTIAGLDEFGDVADPVLASATQPSVAVKVLDQVNIVASSLDHAENLYVCPSGRPTSSSLGWRAADPRWR